VEEEVRGGVSGDGEVGDGDEAEGVVGWEETIHGCGARKDRGGDGRTRERACKCCVLWARCT